MNHIKNMIVPTCTSSASEPDVFGGFVANFNGFHVYYDANLDNEKLLIFSSKSLYFSNYKDGVFAAQVGKEWFIVEDGNLRPLKDDSFVQGKSSQVLGGFAVTEFGRWGYRFVNIESGEEKLFEERRHHIVDVRNDAFYVKKLSEPQALLKLNENFALIESYGFDGQSIVFEQHLNNYLFYVISGTPLYLEVFDLDKFEVVSERKEVQGSILQVFQSEGVFHVFVGGELFLWDGINLKKQNFSKEISAFLAKDNFFYIGFKQDPNVYGFQSATLKPLGRKQIGIDGYHPWSFSKSGAQNVVTL